MKKIFLVLIACTMLVTLASCSSNGNNKAITNEEPFPLTLSAEAEGKVLRGGIDIISDSIETKQGIHFYSSGGYAFKYNADPNLFSFGNTVTLESLKKQGFYITDSDREKEYRYDLKISSNARILKIYFYDSNNELLGTQKCKNNTAHLTDKYMYSKVEYCVLLVKYRGVMYTATFQHVMRRQ